MILEFFVVASAMSCEIDNEHDVVCAMAVPSTLINRFVPLNTPDVAIFLFV